MKTRKILSFILAMIMVFGLCGMAFAEEAVASGEYKYVSSVTPGKEYIIVSNGHAVQKKDGAITDVAVTVSGDTVTLNSGTDALYIHYDTKNHKYFFGGKEINNTFEARFVQGLIYKISTNSKVTLYYIESGYDIAE